MNERTMAEPVQFHEELDARIDKLQAAAERTSGHVRNVYLFFLSFGLYLAIIFGSTTHEQLLRENPVTLPLFDVELPLRGFFWVAPALFVLLHFNLLVQCHLLAGKLKRLDQAIRELGEVRLQAVERARLDVFPFTQMLLGEHRQLPAIMAWVTIVVAPVVLLLFGQASFLPYHDAATTWWHRTLLVLDLAALWLLWPITTNLSGTHQWGPLFLKKLGGIAVVAACLLLTIPGEFLAIPLDRLVGEWGGLVSRNLVVRETNLVGSWPTQAQIDQFGEDLAWQNVGGAPNLRERDLRYADLWRSNFVRGDLRGANLQGARLADANLQGAKLLCVHYPDVKRCTDLQGAILSSANLQGASLDSANLQGASLIYADLQDASLASANLQNATLTKANLQGARLQNANLLSADLGEANLQGADLANAKLTATKLIATNLKGAYLEHAALDGVPGWCLHSEVDEDDWVVNCANFQGADLRNANLQGAVLKGVNLQGADLRDAFLWGASLLGAKLEGADLRGASLWHATVDPNAALYRFSDLRARSGAAEQRNGRTGANPPRRSAMTTGAKGCCSSGASSTRRRRRSKRAARRVDRSSRLSFRRWKTCSSSRHRCSPPSIPSSLTF